MLVKIVQTRIICRALHFRRASETPAIEPKENGQGAYFPFFSLISGRSFKTTLSNELWTSIVPL